jgi:hypothetical protein
MPKFTDKIEKFLEAAEQGAKNASKKGVEALRSFADWLEATTTNLIGAKKPTKKAAADPDEAECEKLCDRLETVKNDQPGPGKMSVKGATPVGFGPGVAIAIELLLAGLRKWLENRKASAEGQDTDDEEDEGEEE